MLYDPNWQKSKVQADVFSLARIYSEAAAAIQKHGHSIGKLRDNEGKMCLWGAISFVADGDALKASTKTRLMLEPLSEFTDGLNPVTWNNHPERTKRQVVSLLRKAARKAAQAS